MRAGGGGTKPKVQNVQKTLLVRFLVEFSGYKTVLLTVFRATVWLVRFSFVSIVIVTFVARSPLSQVTNLSLNGCLYENLIIKRF